MNPLRKARELYDSFRGGPRIRYLEAKLERADSEKEGLSLSLFEAQSQISTIAQERDTAMEQARNASDYASQIKSVVAQMETEMHQITADVLTRKLPGYSPERVKGLNAKLARAHASRTKEYGQLVSSFQDLQRESLVSIASVYLKSSREFARMPFAVYSRRVEQFNPKIEKRYGLSEGDVANLFEREDIQADLAKRRKASISTSDYEAHFARFSISDSKSVDLVYFTPVKGKMRRKISKVWGAEITSVLLKNMTGYMKRTNALLTPA